MIRNGIFALVVLCTFTSCDEKKPDVCQEIELNAPRLILVAGQSNTHAGLGADAILDASQQGIYQLGRFQNNNCVILAEEPLDHHTRVDGRIGFALTFAKLLQQELQDSSDLIIVPCGFGATGFKDGRWNKSNDLYNDAVERVRFILDKYPQSTLVAILWHQGETDIILNNQNYQNDLDNFIINLRSDLANDTVPFILGGMVPYWVQQAPERLQMQQLLKNMPQRFAKVAYADPLLPFVIEKPDNTVDDIHYDAAGQRELGTRYFNQYLSIVD